MSDIVDFKSYRARKPIRFNPKWLRVDTLAKTCVVVEELLADPDVNTWNDAGLEDKYHRPLLLAGYRENVREYADNKYAVVFSGKCAAEFFHLVFTGLKQGFEQQRGIQPYIWQPKKD